MINQFLLQEFGNKIKKLRLDKCISQEKLSFLTGFHRTYIGMIERGERNISLTNMAVFAKVFEMDLSKLMDFSAINPNHNFENYEVKAEK